METAVSDKSGLLSNPEPVLRETEPIPSLLQTVSQLLASRHLYLQGPPKSGRSSLVFDLAYSIAASAPCRCNDGNSHCSCIAVTIFRPAKAQDDMYPLCCQPAENSQPLPTQNHESDSFPKDLLRRIQIRWIASQQDLLTQLLSLQGSPQHEQPRALFLDDLDELCAAPSPLQQVNSNEHFHGGPAMRARQSLVCK